MDGSKLNLGKYCFDLGKRTYVMGILNVTPDSFSDGGKWCTLERAIEHSQVMAEAGADIIDVGGESTRPGSQPISVEEEKRRIIPVVERLLEEVDLPISVDTYKSEVAKDCLRLGAHMINDISALRFDPEMKEVVAASKAAVVLMHIKGRPQDMQENPHYDDLIEEITGYFKEAIKTAKEEGIEKERIVIDPGIGFGKTVAHNLEIMKGLDKFKSLGYPILIGPSRKSVIGKVLDLSVDQRLEGTAACVATCILNGASLIRVHDVKEMVKVAKMCDAIKRGEDYCPS